MKKTERDKQLARIGKMEGYLDQAAQAVMLLSVALERYAEARESIRALSDYYGSEEWKQDFADDEAGLLPHDLKRGVLSEDSIWNLLSDSRDLEERMGEITNRS